MLASSDQARDLRVLRQALSNAFQERRDAARIESYGPHNERQTTVAQERLQECHCAP